MSEKRKYPDIKVEPPGPAAKQWIERGTKVLASMDGHLFRRYLELVTSEAEGCLVKDPDGNTYIDFAQSRATEGHSHPKIIEAVKKYIEKGLMAGFYTTLALEYRVQLAEKLLNSMPGKLKDEGRVAFCNSGTEACDYSLEIARISTQKPILMAFQRAYHGMTGIAMQVSTWNVNRRRHLAPLISDVIHLPFAYCYRCAFKKEYPGCGLACVDYMQEVLGTVAPPDNVAALITEPIIAHQGFITPPPGYFQKVKRLLEEYGILLIADEVYTGFGKTGKFFAIEHWNTAPDIMALGKPLGAAELNLAAVVAPKGLIDGVGIVNEGAFSSGEGGPLICAAALAKLEILHEEKFMENAAKVGNYMMKRLNELAEKYEIIGDVRGKGLLIGVELVKDRKTKEPAFKEAREIATMLFKRGIIIIMSETTLNTVLKISPPLVITEELAGRGLDILEDTLKEVKLK